MSERQPVICPSSFTTSTGQLHVSLITSPAVPSSLPSSFSMTIDYWNRLPDNTVTAATTSSFKTRLDTWTLKGNYWTSEGAGEGEVDLRVAAVKST